MCSNIFIIIASKTIIAPILCSIARMFAIYIFPGRTLCCKCSKCLPNVIFFMPCMQKNCTQILGKNLENSTALGRAKASSI